MASNAIDYTKLVYQYGPSALFVIYFFFSNKGIQKKITSNSETDTSFWKRVYIFNYFFTAFLALIVTVAFFYGLKNLDPKIKGHIKNIPSNRYAHSVYPDLYFKNPFCPKAIYHVDWIYIDDKSLEDINTFEIGLYSIDPNISTVYFEIESSHFKNNPDNISWKYIETINGSGLQFHSAITGEIITLYGQSTRDTPHADNNSQNSLIVPSAWAQCEESVSYKKKSCFQNKQTLTQCLDSDDFIARDDVIRDLAQHITEWIHPIEDIINDGASAYRVRLGVISALRKAKPENIPALQESTLHTLLEYMKGSEPQLRINSMKFLINNRNNERLDTKSHIIAEYKKSKTTKLSPQKQFFISSAYFELLYSLAIDNKDKYVEETYLDISPISLAYENINKAWALKDDVPDSYEIYFLKALYARALIAHDHYTVINRVTKKIDTKLQNNAIQYFEDFLSEYKSCTNNELYPYPNNIIHATRYITNPSSESLR